MLFNSSKLLWILLIARVALAVPLGIEYDTTTDLTPEEEANKVRLEKAKTDANQQIEAMRKGYNLRKTTAKGEFEAAFGKHPNLKHGVISSTIKDLETKNIRVKLATHPFNAPDEDPKSIAAIPWSRRPDAQGNEVGPWTAGKALFSSQFHGSGRNKLNDAGRAGTLIHEATHQLSKTGDNVNKGGNIIQPHDGSSHAVEGRTGYTSAHNMHKTIAKVNADREFTDTRDNANNMHSNAESYAVFASLCSKRNFDRRDIHLFNRALLAGDDDLLVYLARRNSCKVPPKNMAKKAAQKKTSAVKVGTKPLRPLKASLTKPGAARGKTGRQVAAGATRSRVGRLAKAGVTHGVSQHTKATKPVLKGAARAAHGSKVASKARAQWALRRLRLAMSRKQVLLM
ncbi:hypothetical protein BDN70DRAFT_321592 [Pholiota conissans]|uniref:Lysine-specific metallo-endopeptidase domain-containing protein n=1 Tax=Pholiota conissans TaxID=109636 RepID=A0A9P6CP79_9AGAR|nr:hypothetical protein BDN70DRAFT_321592 [Pholiota conissans]